MNKLTVLCCSVLLACSIQLVNAQTSINAISSTSGDENLTSNFIDGISFTPEGILRTTESKDTKSLKAEEAAAITKAAVEEETSSSIEKLSSLQFKYAMMLNVDVESLKNMSLFRFIDDWFGTDYRYGGTTKKGIDCSALTGSLLLAVYGLIIPRTARKQYDASRHITKEELKEGDLVFFNTTGGVSHVGLYLDNHYFVQSSSSQGVTISSLDDAYYASRFICGGRISE